MLCASEAVCNESVLQKIIPFDNVLFMPSCACVPGCSSIMGQCGISLQVWMLKPVALKEQAKELLRGGSFDQALKLAEVCAADGAPWAEEVFAEAAFLLMQGD